MTLLPFRIINCRSGVCLMVFVTLNFFVGASFAMGGYGKENASLWREIIKSMIENRVCSNENECFDKLPVYGYQSNRIYYDIYAPKDIDALNYFVSFVIKNGARITGGVPIDINVYREDKSKSEKLFLGIGLVPFVKIEVKK